MILTAIVISMGIAAFVLAMTYRAYRLSRAEDVANDAEDTRVSKLSNTPARAIDDDYDPYDYDYDQDPLDRRPDTDAPDELDALPGHQGSR